MRRRTFLGLAGTVSLTLVAGCGDDEETDEADDELEPEADDDEDGDDDIGY
jgi:hypothetical protein